MRIEGSHQEGEMPMETARKRKESSVSLRKRFFLGTGVILLFFCAIFALLLYQQGRSLLAEAAGAKSQIVMATVEASQSYVREVLRPKMYEILGQDAFVLEAMSTSYVSRAVMDRFHENMPEYLYRRVAVGARNPAFEANPTEVEVIQSFRADPLRQEQQKIVRTEDDTLFMVYRPVYFTSSCLHCHGDPAEAPASLLERYGDNKGFWHKDGDLAGIMAVGIPVSAALATIREKSLSVLVGGLLVTGVLFLTLGFFFNRVVVNDLRNVLEVFRTGLRDDEEERFFHEIHSQDEITALESAARAMAVHLRDTRRQLEENALHLERTVAERTRELSESEQRLRDKVAARNRELKTLNVLAELTTQGECLSDVFPQVLDHTLNLISADGAGLFLIQEGTSTLDLLCQKRAPNLVDSVPLESANCQPEASQEISEDMRAALSEAACGHISLFKDAEIGDGLNVPLCCRGRVLGVITFVGVELEQLTPEFQELLFSVGRQVGIAIESLQTMRKLLQSKELLQSVFDGISDMVILLDKDLRIKMFNKAYLKRYGSMERDLLGRRCSEIHAGDACTYPECGARKACQSKTAEVEEVVSSSGEIFFTHFYPVLDEQGEVASVVRYSRDITDQRRVEQHIQKTERLASVGQLAAGIAHEINNPLGVILCYTDLLKRQLADQPQSLSDIATVEKHALTCKRIVADLLKFARSDSGSKQLTSINQTIEEAAAMVARQLSQKNIALELDFEAQLPLLSIDAAKMKQVFLNLFMNSQQAMDDGGLIRVSTSIVEDSDRVQVLFWDNGNGISAQVLNKVFDPFFSTKAAGEGTGLGLSVSYGIVRDHGGEIHVASEPGQWTQFTIILPASERP